MFTVLVVDDEPIVRDVVVRYLERDGHRTLEAASGDEARDLLERECPSLVVLDVMLPGVSGLELCRWIRSRSDLPIVMLTALSEKADRIVGLELGADDYLTKPFSPRELAVRVRTLMRRTARPTGGTAQTIAFGDVVIDPIAREAHKGGELLRLTLKELAP
jgi:DNA-binding response OmpR family regulator